MKKLFCLLLVLCVLFCVGCTAPQGGGDTSADPNGGETTGEPEGNTPEWHLSETVEDELMVDYDNIGIEVPLVYEETVRNVSFRFEFFEEFYPFGSLMQVRISVTNNTQDDITYSANHTLGNITYNGDGTGVLKGALVLRPVSDPDNGDKLTASDFESEAHVERVIHVGETLVFERVVRVTPEFFTVGAYKYTFLLFELSPSDFNSRTVEIPMVVIDRNKQ